MKTPKTPSTPERFLRGRQNRARATRRLGKAALKGVVIVACLVVIAASVGWIVAAAGTARGLTVHRVLVEGNEQLSNGEILELLEISEGANILALDLDEVRAKLLRSTWVGDVEIERILPATVKLQIRERRPVAIAVLDDLYLLASDGTVLDQLSPRYDVEKLVLVRGLTEGDRLDPERAELAGRLSSALVDDERLTFLVSELDVSDTDSVLLRLRTPPLTVLVDKGDMVERLREVVPLLEGVQQRLTQLDVVDLRFQGRAYLRLREATAAAPELNRSAAFASGGAPF